MSREIQQKPKEIQNTFPPPVGGRWAAQRRRFVNPYCVSTKQDNAAMIIAIARYPIILSFATGLRRESANSIQAVQP